MATALLFYPLLFAFACWQAMQHAPLTTPLMPRWFWQAVPVICLALIARYGWEYAGMWRDGAWLTNFYDGDKLIDFSAFFAAARVAILHAPELAYDWGSMRDALAEYSGHPLTSMVPFYYPPMALLLFLPLAMFPYTISALVWIGTSLAIFTAACSAIWPRRIAWLIILAAPINLFVLSLGQTGYLVASLFALALVMLPRKPLFAGICFGLLIIKPQFGILIPLLLLGGRQHYAFAVAMGTVLLFTLLTSFVFEVPVFSAWLDALATANQDILQQGALSWNKFQSVYGMARWAGATANIATGLQLLTILALALYGWRLWRSRAPYELKAAYLAVASLAVSPYSFMYDLPLTIVALLFLLADGERKAFTRTEGVALLAIYLLPCGVMLLGYGGGLPIVMGLLALIATRSLGSDSAPR